MRKKLLFVLCCTCPFSIAQTADRETVARPQSQKGKKKRDHKRDKELESPYQAWITNDVGYIISDAERRAFHSLSNDDERENFIEQFWLRRDPTPDTEENEFKEEHYRRIAYANERFSSGIPGWKTDRGMIYIKFGPPDEIDSHPSGGPYQQGPEEGSGQITTFPFERWRYRYIADVGTNVVIEFVDRTMTGEYRLSIDPTEKDALQHTPAGQRQTPPGAQSFRDEFTPLQLLADLSKPPRVRYTDLEAMVNINIRYNTLPIEVRTDYIPITPASIYTNITLQLDPRDLQFAQKDGLPVATVNLYARVTTLSRRVVNVFEDAISLNNPAQTAALYQKTLPLAPGRYRLNVAIKDLNGGTTGSYETVLEVPQFPEDRLSASSLILADLIERVPAKSIGAGPFVIGDTKVRPRVNARFLNSEKLGIYVQLYHLGRDGSVEYSVTRNGTGETVLNYTEPAAPGNASSAQQTIEKWLPLNGLAPGSYTLQMKVSDFNRNQVVTPSAAFTVIQ